MGISDYLPSGGKRARWIARRHHSSHDPAGHAELLRHARDGYLGTAVDDWAGRHDAVASFVHYATAAITAACATAE
ncbi:aminoglycoside adenylyltransferase domain-containing protein [Nocardia jinanensis]|nr:aminoglycoside adenylyltransferase domain-containing protein [Nocardia jinanensis]